MASNTNLPGLTREDWETRNLNYHTLLDLKRDLREQLRSVRRNLANYERESDALLQLVDSSTTDDSQLSLSEEIDVLASLRTQLENNIAENREQLRRYYHCIIPSCTVTFHLPGHFCSFHTERACGECWFSARGPACGILHEQCVFNYGRCENPAFGEFNTCRSHTRRCCSPDGLLIDQPCRAHMQRDGCFRCQSNFALDNDYCEWCVCAEHELDCFFSSSSYVETSNVARNRAGVEVNLRACQVCVHCNALREDGNTTCRRHIDYSQDDSQYDSQDG